MRLRRLQGGQALVEFALVVPLLLVLIVGTIELGLLINHLLVLRYAGYDLARAAAVGQSDAEVISRAGQHARSVVGTSTPSATWTETDPVTGKPALAMHFESGGEWVEFRVSPPVASRKQGDLVHVVVTWGYRPVFVGWIFNGSTFNLESTGRAENAPAP